MFNSILQESVFFSILLTLASFELGNFLRKKSGLAILSPLLISNIVIIITLLIFNISYDTYAEGSKYISYLLTPATVCLAVPLYEKIELLKKNLPAIVLSISMGIAMGLLCILGLSLLFRLEYTHYATLLPKSITTAIALDVSEFVDGFPNVTAVLISITGIFGNISAPFIMKFFKIEDPVARGIGIGTAAHAMGTVKAMEMGKTEGAMSSLALVIAGIVTVILAPIFSRFYF